MKKSNEKLNLRDFLALAVKQYLQQVFELSVHDDVSCFLDENQIVLVSETKQYRCTLDENQVVLTNEKFFKV